MADLSDFRRGQIFVARIIGELKQKLLNYLVLLGYLESSGK